MTIDQLWREKAEKVLRGWLDLAMFHEYGVPEQPTYGPGELEADTIALLTPPTPTPGSEGGGGENPADDPNSCYACIGVPGVEHTCSKAKEFVRVRREDLEWGVGVLQATEDSLMASKYASSSWKRLKADLARGEGGGGEFVTVRREDLEGLQKILTALRMRHTAIGTEEGKVLIPAEALFDLSDIGDNLERATVLYEKDPEMVLVHKSNCDIHNGLPCDCSESAKLAMYHELIMAVGKKYPGESRHQTALRYIREAEKCDCEDVARSALNNGAWSGKGTT